MDILFISTILIILIDFIGILLILLVYFSNKKSQLNQLFCVMTFLALLWITFAFISDIPSQLPNSLIWNRLVYFILSLFFFTTFLFSFLFPKEQKRYLVLEKIIFFISVTIALVSLFTPLVIKDIESKDWGTNLILGNFFPTFAMLGIIWLLSLIILFIRFLKLSSKEKIQTQYFFFGFSIFFIMNIVFNVVFPAIRGSYEFYQFGNFSIIFFLGYTAYAIIAKQLFGIKIILTETLIGIILVILFSQILTAQTLLWRISYGIILALFCIFGYLLIKSVLSEIEQRKTLAILNEKLQIAYKEVEKLSSAKSEFISIASHQIRTPLTAIKGYISMILEGYYGKLVDKVKTPLENVYNSNEKLIKLVNDLLSISRIESGKVELELEECLIEEIVMRVINDLKITAEKKKLYLKLEKPTESLPKTTLDKNKIRQVILNLVDNAIKYTQKGGIMVNIKTIDSKFQITIKDTGGGMSKKDLAKLFGSFSRGVIGSQSHPEGAGLGLYIAKHFVEMHSGRIWAESDGIDKGSTFFIELPIR